MPWSIDGILKEYSQMFLLNEIPGQTNFFPWVLWYSWLLPGVPQVFLLAPLAFLARYFAVFPSIPPAGCVNMISILGLGRPGIPGPHQVSWPSSPSLLVFPPRRPFKHFLSQFPFLPATAHSTKLQQARAKPELENPTERPPVSRALKPLVKNSYMVYPG